MAVQFTINHKITSKDSSNQGHAGQHWTKRKANVDYWHTIVKNEIRRQLKFARPFDEPVVIEFFYRSRLDLDNHASIRKYTIDAMKGLLLHDDNKKHVIGICEWFYADDDVTGDIRVTLTEISEWGKAC